MYPKVELLTIFLAGLFCSQPLAAASQPVEIQEHCLDRAAVPTPQDDAGVRTFSQLQNYASINPNSFGYLESLPGNRIAIALTGDLQTHRAALTKLLDFPERVVICPSRLTKLEFQKLQNEILATASGHILASQEYSQVLRLTLDVGSRAMADTLLSAYGPNESIQLGRFSYPNIHDQTFQNDLPQHCEALPLLPKQRALSWTLDVKNLVSLDGSSARGRLAIRAIKDVRAELPPQVIAFVTEKGATEVLAQLPVNADFAGYEFSKMGRLKKGSIHNLSYTVSPTSCRKEYGWRLPPGLFEVHFRISNEISPAFPFRVR